MEQSSNVRLKIETTPLVAGGSYAYLCSKAETNMMCKGMSVDLLKQNVAVVAVNPGMVATDFGPGKEAMAKMGGMPVSQSCSGFVQIFLMSCLLRIQEDL